VPARPSGNCRISVVETVGGGEGNMKSGARTEVEPCRVVLHSLVILNSVFSLGEGSIRWNSDADMEGFSIRSSYK
jgi:hypothetical protein